MTDPKIVSVDKLRRILTRHPGRKVVFTNGCFDILHYGHVKYLDAARTNGDILVVGLNSDASTRRLKGKGRPFNPQQDRAGVLAGLSCVDYIVFFDEDTPYALIKKIQPDILVKGGDWSKDKIVGADIVRAKKGKVLTIPYLSGRSTTRIIQKISRRH